MTGSDRCKDEEQNMKSTHEHTIQRASVHSHGHRPGPVTRRQSHIPLLADSPLHPTPARHARTEPPHCPTRSKAFWTCMLASRHRSAWPWRVTQWNLLRTRCLGRELGRGRGKGCLGFRAPHPGSGLLPRCPHTPPPASGGASDSLNQQVLNTIS